MQKDFNCQTRKYNLYLFRFVGPIEDFFPVQFCPISPEFQPTYVSMHNVQLLFVRAVFTAHYCNGRAQCHHDCFCGRVFIAVTWPKRIRESQVVIVICAVSSFCCTRSCMPQLAPL